MTNWRGRNKGDEPLPQETPTFWTQAVQREPTFAEYASRERYWDEPFSRYAAPDTNHPMAKPINAPLHHGSDLPYFGDWAEVSKEIDRAKENDPAALIPGTPENDEFKEWNAQESRALWPGRYAEPSEDDSLDYGYASKDNVFGWKNRPYDMEPMYRYGTMPTPYKPQGGDPYNTVLPGYADNPNFKNWNAVSDELNYFRENNPAILTQGTPENDYIQAYNRVAAAEDYPNLPSNATPEDYDRILMEYLKYLQ